MENYNIKDLVKDNRVEFSYIRHNVLYYNLITINGDMNDVFRQKLYQFQVPVEDLGDATFLVRDKAITFMRWIRQAVNSGTLIELKND